MFNEKSSKIKGLKVFGTLGTDYISKNKINTIMMYMGYGGYIINAINTIFQ